jgi:predicted Rossmann-fold nucleotide-binding protein
MGRDFWQPLIDMLDNRFLREKTISPKDLDLLYVTDSPEEAVSYVRDIGLRKFGLSYGAQVKRRWFLFEWGR